MWRRAGMMVLRGGLRALVFVLLGVLAYFIITKFNIPSQEWREQKYLFYGVVGALFFTYMLLEGKRTLRVVSKWKMMQRLLKRKSGPATPAQEAYAKLQRRLQVADEALAALRPSDASPPETFLFIGPRGSGKTSAIQYSGAGATWLDSRGGSPKVGATRDVEWYLCRNAVYLDTSGRYVSDPEASVEWEALLKLIRKRYRRRPLSGIVVSVSLAEVLALDSAGLEGLARTLRARVDDVVQKAGVHCPIQLLVTHADAVEGASEFFAVQSNDTREAVWGHAFRPADHEAEDLSAAFTDSFLDLIRVLERLRLDSIASVSDPIARRRTLLFPAQVAACEPPLNHLVTVLSEDAIQQPAPVAGYWLTSSTQQGMVLDRIEGALSKGLGLGSQGQVRGAPGTSGQRSMFLKEFFTGILPQLSGRSSVSRAEAERRRSTTVRRYIYCGVATGLALLFLFGSRLSDVAELRRIDALVELAVPTAAERSEARASAKGNVPTEKKIQNGRLAALVLLAERVAHIGASIQGLFSCVQEVAEGSVLHKSSEYETAVDKAEERHAPLRKRRGDISRKTEDKVAALLQAAIWYELVRPASAAMNADLAAMSKRLGRLLKPEGEDGTLKEQQTALYQAAVKLRNNATLLNQWPQQVGAALKNSGGAPPDPHDVPAEEWDHSDIARALLAVEIGSTRPEYQDVYTTTARAYRFMLSNLLLSRMPPVDEVTRNGYKVDPRQLAKVERALGTVDPETILFGGLLDTRPENLRQTRAFIQPPVQGIPASFTQAGCYEFFGNLNDEVERPMNQTLHGRTPGDDALLVKKVTALYRGEYTRRWDEWADQIQYGSLNDYREAVDDLEGLYVAQHGGLKDLLSYMGRGEVVPEEERPTLPKPELDEDGNPVPPKGLPPIDAVPLCDTFARTWNDAHQLVDDDGSMKDELAKVVGDMSELHSRISSISAAPSDVARNEAARELMAETLRGQGPLWPTHSSSRTMRLALDNPRILEVVRRVNGGMLRDIWALTVRRGTAAVQNDWNVVLGSWNRVKDKFPFNSRSSEDSDVEDVRALLGSQGELHNFIDVSMKPLLTDLGGGRYRTPDAPLESGIVPRFDSRAIRLIDKINEINAVVDALDERYRVVLTPNRYECKRQGECNDVTSMQLEVDGRLEIEDYFGPKQSRTFDVSRDTIARVTSWTGADARRPCTAREFDGDWAFWRLMAAPAAGVRAVGGKEVSLSFGNNEAESSCSVPVKPRFLYREDRSRGPAHSFSSMQFDLPQELFRR